MWELKSIGKYEITHLYQYSGEEQVIKSARFTPLAEKEWYANLTFYDRLDVRLFLDILHQLNVRFYRLKNLRTCIDEDRDLLEGVKKNGNTPIHLEESLRSKEKLMSNQAIDIGVQRGKKKGQAREICSTAPLTENEIKILWPFVIQVVESLPDNLVEPFEPKERYVERVKGYHFLNQ